jgi:hypothetical protein
VVGDEERELGGHGAARMPSSRHARSDSSASTASASSPRDQLVRPSVAGSITSMPERATLSASSTLTVARAAPSSR